MSDHDVIRAWKDRRYRQQVADALAAHPSGSVELDDEGLSHVAGGDDLTISVGIVCHWTAFC